MRFLDRINRENNLGYCEHIDATNPCGEQPLPDYGCCCLGSLDLCAYASAPFSASAAFDFAEPETVCAIGVRMLDNVLPATSWPRRYCALGHDGSALPPAFVSALDIAAQEHMLMVAAVAPYVDAAISKSVNVPEDYSYGEFQAWRRGLKGITTYRPNGVLGGLDRHEAAQAA